MPPARAGQKQANAGQFKPGKSGNPRGRASGSRNRASLAVEQLLDGEAQALTRRCIELAMEGDTTALRICMERLCPPRRERPLNSDAVKLPRLLDSGSLARVSTALVRAYAAGRVTASEAEAFARVLESHRRLVETTELASRLDALERAQENRK